MASFAHRSSSLSEDDRRLLAGRIMPIPRLDASAPAAEIAAALERDGCLVLLNYADEKARGPLMNELEAVLASTPSPKVGRKTYTYSE